MNCETALELLSASLDGELTPAEEARLQAHLDQCPSCRAVRAELLGIHTACEEMEVLPPAQLQDHILAHLPPQPSAKGAKVLPWRRWAALAAALALVALAAWRLPRSFFEKPAAQTADSAGETVEEAAAAADEAEAAPAEAAGSAQEAINGAGGDAPEAASDGGRAKMAALTGAESAVVEDAVAEDGVGEFNGLERKEVYGAAAAASLLDESAAEGGADAPAGQTRAARRAPLSDPVYTADDDAVPETVPNPEEPPVAAQPFEEAVKDERDFSRYRAVLTLEAGNFSGDYPRQRQENGDMWYLLPLSVLEDPSLLGGAACRLRLEGPDLTADAPYVLLVVPGDG